MIMAQTWQLAAKQPLKNYTFLQHFVKILKGTLKKRLLHLKIFPNILYEVTVFSNLVGFPVGEINQIDRSKKCCSLKYFQNSLTRKAA